MNIPNNLSGSSPLVFWLNKLKEAVRSRTLLPGIGYRINQTPAGMTLVINESQGVGVIRSLRVKSATANYLVCRTWDGTNEGTTDIKVAKPHEARQPASESLAGVTVSYAYSAGPDALNSYRQATGTGISEQQVVIPYWRTNGMISVSATSYSGVDDGAGKDLKLIEVSSRCWAGPSN